MICNRKDQGWELIYQTAHALLAAKLVTHWRFDERPGRWTETLNAVALHDNGWQEWEQGERLTPGGHPRDFHDTPIRDTLIQADRVVTRAWHQSLWVGVLVSRHIHYLHSGKCAEHAELRALIEHQTELREQWIEVLGVSREEVEAAYSILRWGDTFSLLLCMHLLEPDEDAREIAAGPDGRHYQAFRRADRSVGVEPWPYAVETFLVSVDSYRIARETFRDDEDLAEALHHTRPRPLTCELRRA